MGRLHVLILRVQDLCLCGLGAVMGRVHVLIVRGQGSLLFAGKRNWRAVLCVDYGESKILGV